MGIDLQSNPRSSVDTASAVCIDTVITASAVDLDTVSTASAVDFERVGQDNRKLNTFWSSKDTTQSKNCQDDVPNCFVDVAA